MDMDHKDDILPVYGYTNPVSDGQLDRLAEFMEKHSKLMTSRLRIDSGAVHDKWEAIAAELNEMPGGARRTTHSWRKHWRVLTSSAQNRLVKLTSCDKTMANLLCKSFTKRDRLVMKYCALKDKRERRVSTDQDAVILHYLQQYPQMLPIAPYDGNTLMPAAPHEAAPWPSLYGVLNVLGLRRTPPEWRKYIDNVVEEVNSAAYDPATYLERGIARILWPDRFEGCLLEEPPAANIVVMDDYTSRPRRDFMLQFDVLVHYLGLYPRMWAKSDSNAPEWIEMTGIMNIVGPARSPNEWLQLVQTSIRKVHNNERYLMNWFERLLSDRYAQTHPSDATIIKPKSNDIITCGDVYRSDGSDQLQIRCTLCGIVCVNVVMFQQHIAVHHDVETDGQPAMGPVSSFVDDMPTMGHPLDNGVEDTLHAEPIVFVSVQPRYDDDVEDRKPDASLIKLEPNVDDDKAAIDDEQHMLTTVFIKVEPVYGNDDDEEFPTEHIPEAEPLAPSADPYLAPSLDEPRYECDYCMKVFPVKARLRSHMICHRKSGFAIGNLFTCNFCDFKTSLKKSLANHAAVHSAKKYVCAECEEAFAKYHERSKHFKTVHMQPIDPQVASNWTMVEAAGDHHSCPNCEQTFSSSRELLAHRSLQHPNDVYAFNKETGSVLENRRSVTGGRHYRCNICLAVTKSVGDMNKHMIKHSSVKPIMCSRCTFTCNRHYELTTHRRTEHNDGHEMGSSSATTDLRPHVCDICGFRCRHEYAIQRHRRIHTGERPFKCMEVGCEDQAFRLKKSLRVHFMSKHYVGPKAYKCRVCDERFDKDHTRVRHMRKQHPEVPPIAKHRRVAMD